MSRFTKAVPAGWDAAKRSRGRSRSHTIVVDSSNAHRSICDAIEETLTET